MSARSTSALLAEQRAEEGILLSVVVPIYNADGQLLETMQRLQAFRAKQKYLSELIVVDDGNKEPVIIQLAGSGLDLRGIRVLRNDRNCGKGFSVARGMTAARGTYRVFTDADLAYPPSEITKIMDMLCGGADVAVASRPHPESRPMWRRPTFSRAHARHLMSRVFNTAVQLTVLDGIPDTQAGLKGFTAHAAAIVFPRLSIPRFGFDVEALVIARRHGLRIAQTGVRFRVASKATTVRLVTDTARMARDLAAVRWNAWCGRYD